MDEGSDPKGRFERATAWLPMVVSALLVAIVAVFIFAAPKQVVTPKDSGYLIASVPPQMEQTAMR